MTVLATFILDGSFCGIRTGDVEASVLSALGPPRHFEAPHKSYPAFRLYGPLEIRFREGIVTYVGLTLTEGPIESQICDKIVLDEFAGRSINDLDAFLRKHDIDYAVDPIMTDELQSVLITVKGVHLAFDKDDKLTKIAAVGERSDLNKIGCHG